MSSSIATGTEARAVGSTHVSGVTPKQWWLVIASAAGARLAVAFGVLGCMPLQSDALQYSNVAQRILADFPGVDPYFWPPGLLYYLAGIYSQLGTDLWVSRLAMIVLGVASTVMVMRVANRAFSQSEITRTAGWIAALYPPALLISGQTYTQELASLTLLILAEAGLAYSARPRIHHGLIAGAALGIGIITRPSMLSVLILVSLATAMYGVMRYRDEGGRAAWTTAATLALGIAAALPSLLPVMAHNAATGAGWSLSVNNEMNFFMGNNPHTHYYKTSHLAQRTLDRIDPEAAEYLMTYLRRDDRRTAMKHASIDYIVTHPFTTAWRCLSRARAFWGFDYIMSRAIQKYHEGSMLVLVGFLAFEAGGYLLAMMAVIGGLIVGFKSGYGRECGVLAGIALAYQAPYILAFSSGTYHFPVIGLLIPIAGLLSTRSISDWPLIRIDERRIFWTAALIFIFIQLEYGYHAATMSGL